MESLNELVPSMQIKVRKQLENLQLKENFVDLRPRPLFQDADYNLIRCTVDPCHVVKQTKIGTHVIKCYEQYVGKRSKKSKTVPEFARCPFIYHHIIKREHYLSHIKFCDMREIYLRNIVPDPIVQHIAPPAPQLASDEDWDV